MPEFLNWRTDPWLIDNEPIAENQWLTANKLIEQQAHTKIFLQPNILNLYSIMVRKIDFLSGERLLQRLPYITLPDTLATRIRKNSLLLADRCHYYFQKTALEYSIKKWQQKINDYTEKQSRLPFPLFRLNDHWQKFLTQEFVPFQSARGEHFHFTTQLNQDLAYFLGEVIGDGHLNFHNVILVDFSQQQMKYLQTLSQKLFGLLGSITGKNKIWFLHINNKWLVRLVNFLTDQPITGKKYSALREPLIFQTDRLLRWEFWTGVLDADGSYKTQVTLSSSSRIFAEEFANVLDQYNIKYRLQKINSEFGQGFSVVIKAKSKALLQKYICPRHPSKSLDFRHYINRRKYTQNEDPVKYQISNYNSKTMVSILDETYFDFSLLPNLHVVGCSEFLRQVRRNLLWTQQELANYLSITKEKLASYEYRNSFPIFLLPKILLKLPNKQNQLMPFLVKNNLTFFRSRRSLARLDLQPNEKLLSLVKNLIVRKKYFLIKNSDINMNDLHKSFNNYFNIKAKSNQLQNSVLYLYLTTFFQAKKVK